MSLSIIHHNTKGIDDDRTVAPIRSSKLSRGSSATLRVGRYRMPRNCASSRTASNRRSASSSSPASLASQALICSCQVIGAFCFATVSESVCRLSQISRRDSTG